MEISPVNQKIIDVLVEYIDDKIRTEKGKLDDMEPILYKWCYTFPESKGLINKKIAEIKDKIGDYITGNLPYISLIPRNLSHFEKVRKLKEKFLQNTYKNFFERINANSEIVNNILNDEQNLLPKFYLNTEWFGDFVEEEKKSDAFAIYMANYLRMAKLYSFKYLNDNEVDIQKTIDQINLELLKMESYMEGKFFSYKYFDFDYAMTKMFYLASRPDNSHFDFAHYLDKYYDVMKSIVYDFDKSEFENQDAYNNYDFISVCNELEKIIWDRVEEFTLYSIDQEQPKPTIKDLLREPVKSVVRNEESDNNLIKYSALNQLLKNLQFNYPLKHSPMSWYYEWKADLKEFKEEVFDNLIVVPESGKRAYLQKMQLKLYDKKDSAYMTEEDYHKLLAEFGTNDFDIINNISYDLVIFKIIHKDPPDYDDMYGDEYHPSTQKIQYEFYNYHFGKTIEDALEFIQDRLQELTNHSKAEIPKVSNTKRKEYSFETLLTNEKQNYILEMLDDLGVTKNGVSILAARKKGAVRGIAEGLLEKNLFPAVSLEKTYTIIADKIGLLLNSKLDYTNTSQDFKKKTEQYIKNNPPK